MEAVEPVQPSDHVRGPDDASVTVIEYGDYECPHTRAAQSVVDELLARHPDVRFVFRHFPLVHVHERAESLARVAEAADRQGKFWPVHELLFAGGRGEQELASAGVNPEALSVALDDAALSEHIGHDVAAGRAAGVHSTPTFFFNGEKHDGAYDYQTLEQRLQHARAG